jgi:acetate kinase
VGAARDRLVMNTRCGDMDPAVVLYLQDTFSLSPAETDSLLNKKSGLLGLAGKADLRAILQQASDGDPDSQLALDVRPLPPPFPSPPLPFPPIGV